FVRSPDQERCICPMGRCIQIDVNGTPACSLQTVVSCNNPNEVWDDGDKRCVCLVGTTRNASGVCTEGLCPIDKVFRNGACVCPDGQVLNSFGLCGVPLSSTCPGGQVRDARGFCGCRTGQVLVGGVCRTSRAEP